MSSQTTKTLNAFPEDKISLRLSAISGIDKKEISVLDCFHGYGLKRLHKVGKNWI